MKCANVGTGENVRSAPRSPRIDNEALSVRASETKRDDKPSKWYEGELSGLKIQLADTKTLVKSLERRLQESEVARERS